MKKLLQFLAVAVIVVGSIACEGKKPAEEPVQPAVTATEATTDVTTTEATTTDATTTDATTATVETSTTTTETNATTSTQ